MFEPGKREQTSPHVCGIIPIAGQPFDFKMPWHDCLMPISENYTLIEKSIEECSEAGCESIWIVSHYDMRPLVKMKVGEWVYDAFYHRRSGRVQSKELHQKRIPIYYVPIHPKDQGKRDCLGWSVLYGCYMSWFVCKKLSRWVAPDKYFISFPYGLYDLESIRTSRVKISDLNSNFFIQHDGKTVRDGLYTSFAINNEELIRTRRNFREQATNIYISNSKTRLPPKERYSGRFFTLDKVFNSLIIDKKTKFSSISEYQSADSWANYRNFLKSDLEFIRPEYMRARELNKVGKEYEIE